MPPKLLISVRSAAEAAVALRGGADIIDVKEPSSGSLGRAPWETIRAVAREVRACAPTVAVSAALGECIDWIDNPIAVLAELTESHDTIPPCQAVPLTYVKLGPAGMAYTGADSSPAADWQSRLRQVRASCNAALCRLGLSLPNSNFPAPQWVAVAYADHDQAGSPPTNDVLAEAVSSGAPALLLDTFRKDQSTLLDWLSLTDLAVLKEQCRREGILLALAGQLSLPQIAAVLAVDPDIVAVRGAACTNGERGATICADRVRSLKRAMQMKVAST